MTEEMRQCIINKLKELQTSLDTEEAHSKADDALCAALMALGYTDIVKEYMKVQKWYS
jgi:Holliday junction resolvasome RuvABC DNA-binding subunit